MAAAPYERIPVFVRAGAILPLGPQMEWSDEKQPELINLSVYAGADGKFELYEDENTNYNSEKGNYATIPFTYNDKTHTLIIGNRMGTFAGMLKSRRFNVVFVSPNQQQALDLLSPKGKMVKYSGKQVTVKF